MNHPEMLANVDGVGKVRAESIKESVKSYFSLDDLTKFLSENGFTDFEYVVKIHEKLGHYAIAKIKDDPYVIAPILPFDAFPQVDTLAISMGSAIIASLRRFAP